MTHGRWHEERVESDSVGFTRYQFTTGTPGPRLAVLGAVHGDEVLGSLVAGRLTLVDTPIECGELTVIPISHEAAYPDRRSSRIDGLNLAREFPGAVDGDPTRRLAALLTSEVIAASDYLVDLHTSSRDLGTDMPLMAGGLDDGSDYGRRCREMVLAFGAPVTWLHPELGPGRSLTACREAGVPALYVECPEGGRLQPDFVEVYERGLLNLLRHLGLRAATAPAEPPVSTQMIYGHEIEVSAPESGLFQPQVTLLDEVRAGEVVGRLFNRRGQTIAELLAPVDGVVMVMRHLARTEQGDTLVGIAATI